MVGSTEDHLAHTKGMGNSAKCFELIH